MYLCASARLWEQLTENYTDSKFLAFAGAFIYKLRMIFVVMRQYFQKCKAMYVDEMHVNTVYNRALSQY